MPTWGLRRHCPIYNVSCMSFNECLYFSYYLAGHFLDRPHTLCGGWGEQREPVRMMAGLMEEKKQDAS